MIANTGHVRDRPFHRYDKGRGPLRDGTKSTVAISMDGGASSRSSAANRAIPPRYSPSSPVKGKAFWCTRAAIVPLRTDQYSFRGISFSPKERGPQCAGRSDWPRALVRTSLLNIDDNTDGERQVHNDSPGTTGGSPSRAVSPMWPRFPRGLSLHGRRRVKIKSRFCGSFPSCGVRAAGD